MTLRVVHAQVSLPAKNGMTADAAVNTFTFGEDTAGTAIDYAAAVAPAVEAFYNDPAGTDPIASHISYSRTRATDAVEVKWYDITAHLNGSAAGPPILTTNFTLGPTSADDSLPEEVAIALSFHGNYGSTPEFGPGTRPRARHRGRVYVGPLAINNVTNDSPAWNSRPSDALLLDVLAAGEALMDDAGTWVVWSRANAAIYEVVGGWIDNAWDTIRGRGVESTFRNTFGSIV